MVVQVVVAMDKDCQVLDTILALEVSFVTPDAQLPSQALPGPWQLPMICARLLNGLGSWCSTTCNNQGPLLLSMVPWRPSSLP